jgi:hypothetical protein
MIYIVKEQIETDERGKKWIKAEIEKKRRDGEKSGRVRRKNQVVGEIMCCSGENGRNTTTGC